MKKNWEWLHTSGMLFPLQNTLGLLLELHLLPTSQKQRINELLAQEKKRILELLKFYTVVTIGGLQKAKREKLSH